MDKKGTILSGMRPTGALHLGNYFGALENWVKLQNDYNCFFFVADYHALTTGYENTDDYKDNITSLLVDWLAAGLDPEMYIFYPEQYKRTCRTTFTVFNEFTSILAVQVPNL